PGGKGWIFFVPTHNMFFDSLMAMFPYYFKSDIKPPAPSKQAVTSSKSLNKLLNTDSAVQDCPGILRLEDNASTTPQSKPPPPNLNLNLGTLLHSKQFLNKIQKIPALRMPLTPSYRAFGTNPPGTSKMFLLEERKLMQVSARNYRDYRRRGVLLIKPRVSHKCVNHHTRHRS
ncbi:uncharacterized protein VP01_2875g1, partial [Puccinia sorghi]